MVTSLSDRITMYLSLTTPFTESSTSHAMFKGLNKKIKLRSYSAKAHLAKKPLFRGTEQSPSALNPKDCHLNRVPTTTTWPEGFFSAARNLSGWTFAFLVPICLKHFWGPQALCWIEFLLLGIRLESLSRESIRVPSQVTSEGLCWSSCGWSVSPRGHFCGCWVFPQEKEGESTRAP